MSISTLRSLATIALLSVAAFTASYATSAGPPSTFTIDWSTLDGGGGTSVGGGFALEGTIGQADAGTHVGGGFVLDGGYQVAGGPTPPCPGDLDGDGEIAFSDLVALLAGWGACPVDGPCPADLDGNELVDFADLVSLLAGWGPCP